MPVKVYLDTNGHPGGMFSNIFTIDVDGSNYKVTVLSEKTDHYSSASIDFTCGDDRINQLISRIKNTSDVEEVEVFVSFEKGQEDLRPAVFLAAVKQATWWYVLTLKEDGKTIKKTIKVK